MITLGDIYLIEPRIQASWPQRELLRAEKTKKNIVPTLPADFVERCRHMTCTAMGTKIGADYAGG